MALFLDTGLFFTVTGNY